MADLDVVPLLSSHDASHSFTMDTKLASEPSILAVDSYATVLGSDCKYIGFCKFCSVVTRTIRCLTAALFDFVNSIFRSGTEKPMSRVLARRVVAGMADVHFFRRFYTMPVEPADTSSRARLAVLPEAPIATRIVLPTVPLPAHFVIRAKKKPPAATDDFLRNIEITSVPSSPIHTDTLYGKSAIGKGALS